MDLKSYKSYKNSLDLKSYYKNSVDLKSYKNIMDLKSYKGGMSRNNVESMDQNRYKSNTTMWTCKADCKDCRAGRAARTL